MAKPLFLLLFLLGISSPLSHGCPLGSLPLSRDRNGMDLTEAEDIKKRWQEYTEELYKKDLNDSDNHDGVIMHLKPDFWNVKSSGP